MSKPKSPPRRNSNIPVSSWVMLAFSVQIATCQVASGLDADRWRWSNPMPHGNNVYDMLITDDASVQVGDAGAVQIRKSEARWVPALTGVTNYLRGVTLFGSRILVVGETGAILWSDDGRVFQSAQLTPGTDAWFEGVAASTERAVAVGDFGTIYTSTNGVDWVPVSSGTSEWFRGVTWSGSGFVAVGEYGTLRKSSSGISWSGVSLGTSQHLNRVRSLGKGASAQLVAVGTGGAAFTSSSWNSNWTPITTGTTNSLYDVALNDHGMLLVGDQEVRFRPAGTTTWTSQITDPITNTPQPWVYLSCTGSDSNFLVAGRSGLLYEGTTSSGVSLCDWTPLPDSSHAWLWDLMVQNGTYTAVGDLATILTSLDGIVWAREVVPDTVTNTVLLGVGGDTNHLFAVGNAGVILASHAGLTNVVVTNYLGTNLVVTNAEVNSLGLFWTQVTGVSTQNLQGVAAKDGTYLISGAQGTVLWSEDGTNWTTRSTPTTSFLSGLAAFDGGWVACGADGTLLHAGADASSWTPVSTSTANWLYRVRQAGERLVVVGQNGACLSSVDGMQWTPHTTGTSEWLNDVAYVEGTWYVVGTQGALLSSTNLTEWTPQRVPTIKSLFTAAASDGQLVLGGIEGVILRNAVVPLTTPVDLLDYTHTIATNIVGASTNAVSEVNAYEIFLFAGQADQQFEFQSCTNLSAGWTNLVSLELYDPSATLYLIRTRATTNTPPEEFYRTRLIP